MNPASSLDQGRRVTTPSDSVTTGSSASVSCTTIEALSARLDEMHLSAHAHPRLTQTLRRRHTRLRASNTPQRRTRAPYASPKPSDFALRATHAQCPIRL